MTSDRKIELRSATNRVRNCTCGAPVKWATTAGGRPICLEFGAAVTKEGEQLFVLADDVHWARCPHADQHRKRDDAKATAKAVEERFAPLQKEARELRELLLEVVVRTKAGDTRRQIVDLIETRLRDIGPRGPALEDVYPEGRRRWCGD